MNLKVRHKLFLALLATVVLVLILTALLTRLSFERGFLDYVNAIERQRAEAVANALAQAYEAQGDWEFLRDDRRLWREFLAVGGDRFSRRRARRLSTLDSRGARFSGDQVVPPPPHDAGPPPPRLGPRDARPPKRGSAPEGIKRQSRQPALFDAQRQLVIGQPASDGAAIEQPIEVNGAIVGYFRIDLLREVTTELDLEFARQQNRSMYMILAFGLGIAAIGAPWLARHLVAPVRVLAAGARSLAVGDYSKRITVSSRDELGQLSKDFNVLAQALEHSRASRRAFFADISHELRTPLTIISGEIQALQDGVRELNLASLDSLSIEASRMNKLVEDIYNLALTDAGALTYQNTELDLAELTAEVTAAFASRIEAARLTLETRLEPPSPNVLGDRNRLAQLIANLVENSVRYTAPGGTVRVSCSHTADTVELVIDDSAPAPGTDAFEQLFEPLFREERSRSRETGGAGLGLAIAKRIATAHQGSIAATRSPLGGLRVRLRLLRKREAQR